MNPCFLLASRVGIESLSAFIFILCTVTLLLLLLLLLLFMLRDDPFYYVFTLGDDPFYYVFTLGDDLSLHWEMTHYLYHMHVLGYTFLRMYSMRPIIHVCCHTCGMFIITCLSFSFKHIVYFLECVRDPCLLLLFR